MFSKNSKLLTLWQQRQPNKSKEEHLLWFNSFSEVFLQSYRSWNPEKVKIKCENAKQKRGKFLFEFSQKELKEAVANDCGHSQEFIVMIINIFLEFKNLIKNYISISSSNESILNFLSSSRSKFKIASSFEIFRILVESKFNRQTLFNFGLFDLLLDLTTDIKSLLQLIKTQLRSGFENKFIMANVVLLQFLLSRTCEIIQSFCPQKVLSAKKDSKEFLQAKQQLTKLKNIRLTTKLIEIFASNSQLDKEYVTSQRQFEMKILCINLFEILSKFGVMHRIELKNCAYFLLELINVPTNFDTFKPFGFESELIQQILQKNDSHDQFKQNYDIFGVNFFYFENRGNLSANIFVISNQQNTIQEAYKFGSQIRRLSLIFLSTILTENPWIQNKIIQKRHFVGIAEFILWDMNMINSITQIESKESPQKQLEIQADFETIQPICFWKPYFSVDISFPFIHQSRIQLYLTPKLQTTKEWAQKDRQRKEYYHLNYQPNYLNLPKKISLKEYKLMFQSISEKPMIDLNLKSNSRLNQVFTLLIQLCQKTHEISFRKHLFRLFIDLYRGKFDRNQSIPPDLQIYILDFFIQIVEISDLPFLRSVHFWDVLFCDFFHGAIFQNFAQNENQKSNEKSNLIYQIKTTLFDYITFFIITGKQVDELIFLVNLMLLNYSNLMFMHEILVYLLKIIRVDLVFFPQAIYTKLGSDFLVYLMQSYSSMQLKYNIIRFENEFQGKIYVENQEFDPRLFLSVRELLFDFFALFQFPKENKLRVLNQSKFTQLLLDLTFEPNALKYSLELISQLFQCIEQDFSSAHQLIVQYVEHILHVDQLLIEQKHSNSFEKSNPFLLKLIQKLIQLVVKEITQKSFPLRNQFIKANSFLTIVHLLSNEKIQELVLRDCLMLLRYFLSDDYNMFQAFESQAGWKMFEKLLKNCDKSGDVILSGFLDILVSDSFDQDVNFIICNPSIVLIPFEILYHFYGEDETKEDEFDYDEQLDDLKKKLAITYEYDEFYEENGESDEEYYSDFDENQNDNENQIQIENENENQNNENNENNENNKYINLEDEDRFSSKNIKQTPKKNNLKNIKKNELKNDSFLELLSIFITICKKSTHNISVCCNEGLLTFLLDLIPKCKSTVLFTTLELISLLGTHLITVTELKKIFTMIQMSRSNSRMDFLFPLLTVFKKIVNTEKEGPDTFFDFHGKDSLIELPPIEKWPSNKGYSFCTWMQIEQFFTFETQQLQPVIFSFSNQTNEGFQFYFSVDSNSNSNTNQNPNTNTNQNTNTNSNSNSNSNNLTINSRICLTVYTGKNKFELRFKTLIPLQKWFFLGLTHKNIKGEKYPNTKLFINGEVVGESSVAYPKLKAPLTKNHIGASTPVFLNPLENVKNSFCGQMGTIYIFDDFLNQETMKKIYLLGSNYHSCFDRYEYSRYPEETSGIFDGTLMSKIVFCLNSKASEKGLLYNQSPNDRLNTPSSLHHMFSCFTSQIPEMIDCIGGIQMVLPLFSLVDVDPHLWKQNRKYCRLVFNILCDVLVRSKSARDNMVKIYGFAIISYFLKRSDPNSISFDLMNPSLMKMLFQLKEPNLERSIVVDFLMDFDLWIYCNDKTQKQLMEILTAIINISSQSFSTLSPRILLDVIRLYYWPEEERGKKNLRGKSTKKKHRIKESSIEGFASDLLHICELFLNSKNSTDLATHLRFLVLNCFFVPENRIVKILEVIQRIVKKGIFPVDWNVFLEQLTLGPFLTIMSSHAENPHLIYVSLDIIYSLLESVLGFHALSRQDVSVRTKQQPMKIIPKHLQKLCFLDRGITLILSQILKRSSVNFSIYHRLFALSNVPPPRMEVNEMAHSLSFDPFGILKIIFSLIATNKNEDSLKALEIARQVFQSKISTVTALQDYTVQQSLLGIVDLTLFISPDKISEMSKQITDLAFEILSIFHMHFLVNSRRGWSEFGRSILLINEMFANPMFSQTRDHLIHRLIQDLLDRTEEFLLDQKQKNMDLISENICQLILFVSHYRGGLAEEGSHQTDRIRVSLRVPVFTTRFLNLLKLIGFFKPRETETSVFTADIELVVLVFLFDSIFRSESSSRSFYLSLLEKFLSGFITLENNNRALRMTEIVLPFLVHFALTEHTKTPGAISQIKAQEINEGIEKILRSKKNLEKEKYIKNRKENLKDEKQLHANLLDYMIYICAIISRIPNKTMEEIIAPYSEDSENQNVFQFLRSGNPELLLQIFSNQDLSDQFSQFFTCLFDDAWKKLSQQLMMIQSTEHELNSQLQGALRSEMKKSIRISNEFSQKAKFLIQNFVVSSVNSEIKDVQNRDLLRFQRSKLISNRCREFLREIMQNPSLWSSLNFQSKFLHWKLNATEDTLRRRRRFKPNRHFTDHADAAISSIVSEEPFVKSESQSEIDINKQNNFFAHLFVDDQIDSKKNNTNIESGDEVYSDSDDINLTPQDSENFGLNSDENDKQPNPQNSQYLSNYSKFTTLNQSSKQVRFRCICERIKPLRKIPGIFEITFHSLNLDSDFVPNSKNHPKEILKYEDEQKISNESIFENNPIFDTDEIFNEKSKKLRNPPQFQLQNEILENKTDPNLKKHLTKPQQLTRNLTETNYLDHQFRTNSNEENLNEENYSNKIKKSTRIPQNQSAPNLQTLISSKGNNLTNPNYLQNSIVPNTSNLGNNFPKTTRHRFWEITSIIKIMKRRYLLQETGMEIFFANHKSLFLRFANEKQRNQAFNKIVNHEKFKVGSGDKRGSYASNPRAYLKHTHVTARWQHREISNFEYLMELNTIAGRSYNDLSQYPVFPWIISDYDSLVLDLNDPKNFRDLSMPIGALLGEERRKQLAIKFAEATDMIPFHYASHYSNVAIVLWFLLRVEPFTSLAIELQGGKFDKPDRMFFSIEQTWNNCLNNAMDVKELIPEFFYFPEFLENSEQFQFGTTQDGRKINNVQLPPWGNTPHDFIRIHAAALESDYVSAHLNEWIDLIFGYKQQGIQAQKSFNVFNSLSYSSHVDFSRIPQSHIEAVLEQIEYFGQTPFQLFHRPHPQRLSQSDSNFSLICRDWNRFTTPNLLDPQSIFSAKISKYPVLSLRLAEMKKVKTSLFGVFDKLVVITSSRQIKIYRWIGSSSTSRSSAESFLHNTAIPVQKSSNAVLVEDDSTTKNKFPLAFSLDHKIHSLSNCFCITEDTRFLIGCGFWDASIKVTSLESFQTVQSVEKHKNVVTCLAFDSNILVTGSRDTTIMIWKVTPTNQSNLIISENPLYVLYGHDDEITGVSLSYDSDIVVSCSKNGKCLIYSLMSGQCTQMIEKSSPFQLVSVGDDAYIYSVSGNSLGLIDIYSINGTNVNSVSISNFIVSMQVISQFSLILIATNFGKIQIYSIPKLLLISEIELKVSVTAMFVSVSQLKVFLADNTGKLFMIPLMI